MTPSQLDRACALFLDLDGTLLEIAATPDSVVVPSDLPRLLGGLHLLLGGALAIVTGRSVEAVDALLTPFVGSVAGEHGAVLRHYDGRVEDTVGARSVPLLWRESLRVGAEHWPGVLVERKPHGVAVHYRLAPQRGGDVQRAVRALVRPDHRRFRLFEAHAAVEIGPRAASKGRAVERLMADPPFHGRRPLFIGDDETDEAGMAAARALGGEGLRVAEAFDGEPAAVRAWLARGVEVLARRPPPDLAPASGP